MTAAHNKCLRVYFYKHTAVYVYTITEGDSNSIEERTVEVPAWNGHVLESRTPNTTDLWLTNLIDTLPSLLEKTQHSISKMVGQKHSIFNDLA